jgi:hypothetical protein
MLHAVGEGAVMARAKTGSAYMAGRASAAFLAWYWSLPSWSGWLAPYKETRFKKIRDAIEGRESRLFLETAEMITL